MVKKSAIRNSSLNIRGNILKVRNLKIKYLPDIIIGNTEKDINIAIIIPYRNRREHLNRFLKHIESLNANNATFDIFVIEQKNDEKFNRGLLLNIGYNYAKNMKTYDRYIFHDVDSYPSQTIFSQYGLFLDKNIHFASPYLGYKYKYERFMGGVMGISSKDFETANGFSNIFFGWGGEDDSFYNRMVHNSIVMYRPSVGNYTLIDHDIPTDAEYNMDKRKNIAYDSRHWKTNGLNQLITHPSAIAIHLNTENNMVPRQISPNIFCFFVEAEFSKEIFAMTSPKKGRTTRTLRKSNKRNTKRRSMRVK